MGPVLFSILFLGNLVFRKRNLNIVSLSLVIYEEKKCRIPPHNPQMPASSISEGIGVTIRGLQINIYLMEAVIQEASAHTAAKPPTVCCKPNLYSNTLGMFQNLKEIGMDCGFSHDLKGDLFTDVI